MNLVLWPSRAGELDRARDLFRETRAQAEAFGFNHVVRAADAKLGEVGKGDKGEKK